MTTFNTTLDIYGESFDATISYDAVTVYGVEIEGQSVEEFFSGDSVMISEVYSAADDAVA